MQSRELRFAISLVLLLLAIGVVGVVMGTRDRGDAAAAASGASDGPQDEETRMRRLERRMELLEEMVGRLRETMTASSRSGVNRNRSTGAEAPNETAGMAPAEALAWLEHDEVQDLLREAIVEESARAVAEARIQEEEQIRRATARARDRHLDALAEAVGLTAYETDGISRIVDETQARQLALETRARELLMAPGPITDELRESVALLREDRKQILVDREGQIRALVGDEKYRGLRQYQRDQDRKLDIFYGLTDWEPQKPPAKKKSSTQDRARKQPRRKK